MVAFRPVGGQFRTQEFDRKRDGIAIAAQWESVDRRATVTAQFLRSHATQNWGEYTFEAGVRDVLGLEFEEGADAVEIDFLSFTDIRGRHVFVAAGKEVRLAVVAHRRRPGLQAITQPRSPALA
mgnify:CR=1 FL=1